MQSPQLGVAPDGQLIFELADDGSGIDYAAVRAKERALGMPADTLEELPQALFSDGFSTRDTVSELSGRGVGLSASRAACTEMSGTLELQSSPGHGTCLRCIAPVPPRASESSLLPARSPFARSARPLHEGG